MIVLLTLAVYCSVLYGLSYVYLHCTCIYRLIIHGYTFVEVDHKEYELRLSLCCHIHVHIHVRVQVPCIYMYMYMFLNER